ncbi:hypothetical protein BOTBODRAFT_35366 [Botryobasidium botryosum FD-172 SS1]|uniref:CxC5 like cysteine cluster associated with KDZ domain-containing protein n=1 Tax=Botryobasidium botryosum (strain FD-172 SS1) TaxID=930990 RepID=A0A067M6T8_BOTB1|nr:hypothetical protein BOTBODRAFT_35366 [Botryobasidium botryosum FD-172 SS1]
MDLFIKITHENSLKFSTAMRFVNFISLTRDAIVDTSVLEKPPSLPTSVIGFLSKVLDIDTVEVEILWDILGDFAWSFAIPYQASKQDIEAFMEHGLERQLGYRDVYPPYRACAVTNCPMYGARLTDHFKHKATLFTSSEGALPIFTHSLRCRGCRTSYYHNYRVDSATSTRVYYGGVPDVIQVAMHYYIESSLLESFTTYMFLAWVSATNCARVYNMKDSDPFLLNAKHHGCTPTLEDDEDDDKHHGKWQTSLRLTPVFAFDGFLLYSLLRHHEEQNTTLSLPHDNITQSHRLDAALEARNKQMEGTGQEYWAHACDICLKLSTNVHGDTVKMQAAVSDGDTIGHYCCGVHNCRNPLPNIRAFWCHEHVSMADICAAKGCDILREVPHRTCPNPEHRALEKQYYARGKSLFVLRNRLEAARAFTSSLDTMPVDPVTLAEECSTIEGADNDNADMSSSDPEVKMGKRLRAQFARKRTSNEQLIMRPCGVIVSRTTCFGSEAISAVEEFVRKTFPTTQAMPEYFFYDNNCQLWRYVRNRHEEHWRYTAMPVDVFHHNAKHKASDIHCQLHCNPAGFPEIITHDGHWVFNTSIAEQTNGWFGKFQAIVRDMEVVRFNFFLDEMIKRRNRLTVAQLRRDGHSPILMDKEALLA